MKRLVFHRYKMNRLLSVRQLSTVHYFSGARLYDTPAHSHNTWEFVYCEKGHVTVWDDVRRIELNDGEITFHQPGIPHHIHVGETPTTMFLLSFACTNECMKLFSRKHLKVNAEQTAIMDLIVQELKDAFELNHGQLQLSEIHPSTSAPAGAEQLICGHLEWLLISMIRSGVDAPAQDSVSAEQLEEALETRIMTELKSYVNAHLGDMITIEELARHVHYSRTYITVQFKAATGMSIMDYVEQQRINRAKELLLQGNRSVTQIADELGYSSIQYFSRRFRKAVGCAPSQYAYTHLQTETMRGRATRAL